MVKGKTRFALILFFNAGLAPADIIDMGYPKASVYKYSRYFKDAQEEFKGKMKRK